MFNSTPTQNKHPIYLSTALMSAVCFIIVLLWTSSLSTNIYYDDNLAVGIENILHATLCMKKSMLLFLRTLAGFNLTFGLV